MMSLFCSLYPFLRRGLYNIHTILCNETSTSPYVVIDDNSMAHDTRQLLAGMILSLAIVVGTSAGLRMLKSQMVEAASSPFVVACIQ